MTKLAASFRQAYQALNAEQQLAVDTIDGPVMLVAGPGTGKTQTLALRIANILRVTDVGPSSILALTFTDSGARAMRLRLLGLIGETAYRCEIHTFHSFAKLVISDNPDSFLISPNAEPLSELDQLSLIYSLLDQFVLPILRPVGAPHHYAQAILSAISHLKREAIDEDDFKHILDKERQDLDSEDGQSLTKTMRAKREKNLEKNYALLQFYRAYEAHLRESHRFDFDDMVTLVTQALKQNELLLQSLQERFHYFLVDEYQDTNSAQNELLLLLASYWGEEANIFVAGDPDQSIMRFQGASLENQLTFSMVYPHATVITLQHNYRSTQALLDAANLLISHNHLHFGKVASKARLRLLSHSGDGIPLKVAKLNSGTTELLFLAEHIRAQIQAGTSPSDIAIIYRKNQDFFALASILTQFGIAYTVQGGGNILEDPLILRFLKLLRVIDSLRVHEEEDDLFAVLHYPIFHLDSGIILDLARRASQTRTPLFDVLQSDPTLKPVAAKFTAWQTQESVQTFPEFFATVLQDSGYLNYLLENASKDSALLRFNTLFDEIKRQANANHSLNLSQFLTNLKIMTDNNLRLSESDFGKSSSTITLTTAHKSKGLEWAHVYLYRAIDGIWGNSRKRDLISLPSEIFRYSQPDKMEQNEDERRLFYVAMTRAKTNLTLCHASSYSTYGSVRAAVPTQFILEIGSEHLENIETSDLENNSPSYLKKLLAPSREDLDRSPKEAALLQELVSGFSFSATSLNTYLQCAYKFKLDKLIRVPHSKKPHLAFGTAIHRSLELFYQTLKTHNIIPSKKSLLDNFAVALGKELLTPLDYSTRLAQGKTVLDHYYDLHLQSFRVPLYLEKSLRAVVSDIPLSGKLDRIDWLDKNSNTVRVIDYKTGKDKTRGQIEGSTQDSTGDLKRQLIFYKLLIDHDPSLSGISLGEAMLDFVETGKQQTYKIQDEEVAELTKTLEAAMAEVRALHFPRTTNLKACATCVFRDHCYPGGLPT